MTELEQIIVWAENLPNHYPRVSREDVHYNVPRLAAAYRAEKEHADKAEAANKELVKLLVEGQKNYSTIYHRLQIAEGELARLQFNLYTEKGEI